MARMAQMELMVQTELMEHSAHWHLERWHLVHWHLVRLHLHWVHSRSPIQTAAKLMLMPTQTRMLTLKPKQKLS